MALWAKSIANGSRRALFYLRLWIKTDEFSARSPVEWMRNAIELDLYSRSETCLGGSSIKIMTQKVLTRVFDADVEQFPFPHLPFSVGVDKIPLLRPLPSAAGSRFSRTLPHDSHRPIHSIELCRSFHFISRRFKTGTAIIAAVVAGSTRFPSQLKKRHESSLSNGPLRTGSRQGNRFSSRNDTGCDAPARNWLISRTGHVSF